MKHFKTAHLPDSLMNKGALKVTVVAPSGLRVDIWNVHLQDGITRRIRLNQIAELIEWINQAQDGQVADVVGGDFNFTPDSEEFRRFVSAVGPDVHLLANDKPFPTWDGLRLCAEANQTLDHIFVRVRQPGDEVGARARKIFTATQFKDRLSDHLGLEALLTFRNALENNHPILVGQKAERVPVESPF